jgi:hypothetical protein
MQSDCKDALQLYGKSFKYALPDKNRPGSFRTKHTPRFEESLHKTIKQQLPLFDLWSVNDFKLVAADYDKVPEWYRHDALNYLDDDAGGVPPEEMLWENFRYYLSHRYGKLGLVIPTPSSKAKILFLVLAPPSTQMSHSIALDTLQHLLEEWDFAGVDAKAAALNRLYVNAEMLAAMQSGLEALLVHEPVLDSLDQEPISGPFSRPSLWDLPPLPAEEQNALGGVIQHEVEWFIVRFMGSMPTASLESIALPQIFLSRQSSHHPEGPFGQAAISRAVNALVNRGLLAVVDDRYAPGKKAKLYRAEGVLREVMARLNLAAPKLCDPEATAFLSQDIPDGQWDDVLWKATNFFRDEASYLTWVQGKQGVELRGRQKKAQAAWRCHVDPKFNRTQLTKPAHLPPSGSGPI